jgi:hypothetical protein
VLDRDAGRCELLELFDRSREDGEGAEVARHAALGADQLECDGCFARSHGVVIADRDDRDVGFVDAADQLHVAEHAGVSGEIERRAVGGLQHDSRRLAGVGAVRRGARMERVRQRDLHAIDVDRAALVRSVHIRFGNTLLPEPAAELDERDDLAVVLFREADGVSDVVAVPMRERDDVDALRRLLALGALRIPVQERVDVDALAVRGIHAEGRVAEPRQCGVRHRSPFSQSFCRA